MTEISATQYHNHFRLQVENHAGTSPVCAAVSALVYALAGTIRNNPSVDVHYETLEPGHAMIDYISHDELGAEDMRCVLIGLMQIQEAHPDELNIVQNIFLPPLD